MVYFILTGASGCMQDSVFTVGEGRDHRLDFSESRLQLITNSYCRNGGVYAAVGMHEETGNATVGESRG